MPERWRGGENAGETESMPEKTVRMPEEWCAGEVEEYRWPLSSGVR